MGTSGNAVRRADNSGKVESVLVNYRFMVLFDTRTLEARFSGLYPLFSDKRFYGCKNGDTNIKSQMCVCG